MKEIHHFLIILLHFIITDVLGVIYVSCICRVRILYNGVQWISSWFCSQCRHIWYLKIGYGESVYTLAIGKPSPQSLWLNIYCTLLRLEFLVTGDSQRKEWTRGWRMTEDREQTSWLQKKSVVATFFLSKNPLNHKSSIWGLRLQCFSEGTLEPSHHYCDLYSFITPS